MAKQSTSRPSAEPHGLLRGLIDAIHHLFIMISSRLRHTRIHHSPMGDAKGEYDIWEKLGTHLEQASAESKPDTKSHATGKRKVSDPGRHENPATTVQDFNRLTEHSKQKAVNQLLPSMNEQLQGKTMEHINISLILAKEGNADGARLHIELAENAMHTASRFMSHEDYDIFEKKVERRLESIVDRDRPVDSGT